MEKEVEVDGEKWFLYTAEFRLSEKVFSFNFYARSDDEAMNSLAAIKETAELKGRIVG